MQVKEPNGNLDNGYPATRSVQSTPADNTRKRVWQYIEKEKKERNALKPPSGGGSVAVDSLFMYLQLFVEDSVFGLCFGMHNFVSFLVLQSS